jgi:flagellar hook-associated protein 3 FlgL
MVTRISTAASNQVLVNRMLEQQQRVHNDQTQLSTGFKSQDYLGIAGDTFQLLNVENEKARMGRYISNNQLVSTTLKAQQTSVQGIDDTARMIRSELISFAGRDLSSQNPENMTAVNDLQNKVFSAFSQIQYFLSQKIDGKYIFGGAMSDKPPFDLPYDSLQDFQNFYDGISAVFPSTRVANLVDIAFDAVPVTYSTPAIPLDTITQITGAAGDFISQTIDQTATGNLIFSNVGANGKITAATPGAFRSLQVGQTILINNTAAAQGAGTPTDNNGVYTITAVSPDGNSITLDQAINAGTALAADNVEINLTVPNGTTLALSGSVAGNNGPYTITWPSNADFLAAGIDFNSGAPDIISGDGVFTLNQIPVTGAGETITLQSNAFLKGTSLSTEQRISDTQSIKLDVTGLDPAFEKVVRAFGILAQGDLINHPERVNQTLAALNDGIEHSSLQPTEMSSDLQNVQDRIANNIKALTDAKDVQTQFMAFLEGRQNELEGADKTEAAVRLQTDSATLEISYATLSKITQLSLLNYL